MSITPPEEGHRTLTVWAKDRAGNLSENPAVHRFLVGKAGLAQPDMGATVVKRMKIAVDRNDPAYTRVTFQYRRGPGSVESDIPLANLRKANGDAIIQSRVPLANLGAHATWNAIDTLGSIGGVVDVRALLYTASDADPPYATAWVRTTVDPNGDGAAALFTFGGARGFGNLRGSGAVTDHVGDVAADRRVQHVGVQTGEDSTEGLLAGHDEPAGERITVGAQPPQHRLRGPRGPLSDRRHAVTADHQRRARGQDQDDHQRMPKPAGRAAIGNGRQTAHQRRFRHELVGPQLSFPQSQVGELLKSGGETGNGRTRWDTSATPAAIFGF